MDNLRMYRKRKGLSQADIANLLGIAQNSYSRYENGARQPDVDMLNKMADILDVSVDELLGREKKAADPEVSLNRREITVKPAGSSVKIPLVGSFRCGYNGNGEGFYQYDEIEVAPSLLSRYGKNLVAYIAIGSSMKPTIFPGDLMFAVPGDVWEDDDIVALVIDDAEMIKRIRRAPDGGIDVIPDNEAYRQIHLSPKDLQSQQVAVLARIVKIERDL